MKDIKIILNHPVILQVKDSDSIEKGVIIKRKGYEFLTINEKIAYDGITQILVWFLGSKE